MISIRNGDIYFLQSRWEYSPKAAPTKEQVATEMKTFGIGNAKNKMSPMIIPLTKQKMLSCNVNFVITHSEYGTC